MVIDTTEVVAWWGAVIATVVFAWDIYKWKSAGAKLRMSVSSGMLMTGGKSYWNTESADKLHIVVRLSNIGDRPTTITHLAFLYFPTWFSRLRGRPKHSFIAVNPNPGQPIPHEMKEGTIWIGTTDQTPDFEQYATEGHLIAQIFHSHSTRPEQARVVITKKETAPQPGSD